MRHLFRRFSGFCFLLSVAGIFSSNAWFLNNAWADDIPALSSWVSKKPTDSMDKINFFEHPFFYQAVQQGIPEPLVEKIMAYAYHQPVEKIDHYLVLQGSECFEECGSQPGFFNVNSYAMLVDITPQTNSRIWQPRVVLCLQEYHQVGDQKDRRQYTNIIHYYTDNGEGREVVAANRDDNNGGCTMGNEFYEAADVMKHLSLVGELFQHLRFSGAY